MKLFVPACGDRITLSKAWTFTLWLENRNCLFAKAQGVLKDGESNREHSGKYYNANYKKSKLTLPKETILECDRVYIRASSKSKITVANDYDSITWKVIVNGKAKRHSRFWAKLSDCNQIQFDHKTLSTYRDRVKLIREIVES